MNQLTLLFGMKVRVTRRPYILWGLSLMFLKYLGECLFTFLAVGKILTPLNFLSPLWSERYPDVKISPDWFVPAILLWSIPFIWIGVGTSIRRAADANLSPWVGILFFFPGVNYLLILVLTLMPTSAHDNWSTRHEKLRTDSVASPLISVLVCAIFGTVVAWFFTNYLMLYASSLFVGSPLILGLVQGYFLNSKSPLTIQKTVGFVEFTILLIHLFLLVFSLEGVICLAMSLPISGALGFVGAVFGRAIAKHTKGNRLSPAFLLLVLPVMPLGEMPLLAPHQDVVLSSIEIDVPPEKVWPNVIKFSDLPPNSDWLFQLGVAHPIRARIEGSGVGAVRHCEFSTGAFVEPITTWDEPNHLAFDVKYQPQPMKELSFYDQVDAPHLNGYFRSVKGEFRLVRTADGKTLLEGRTWYEMDMHPGWYWQMYGRWFIHKIHLRVLDHIKNLSENKI